MLDILAITSECEAWPVEVRYAADLAARLGATLTGLHLGAPEPEVPEVASASLHAELVEIARAQAEAARTAEPAFRAWARDNGVARSAWFHTRSSAEDALARVEDWYDLVVLGRDALPPWDDGATAGRMLLSAALPFVLVPGPGAVRPPATIAVAWKSTRESLRALHSALPLLALAQRVILLRSRESDRVAPPDWSPALHIADYLARHDIRVADGATIDILDDERAPARILDAAAEERADLLVMGAYGRSRISEWIFGGATRHALTHAPIPVFMRH